MEGRLFGMKAHLMGNVGEGPGQFQQGQAGLGFGRFLLAHGGMTTRAASFGFFLLGWRPQGPMLLGILFGAMIGIGTSPLLFGGTGQLFPPRLFLPLFRRFLLDELHHVGITSGRRGVTGPRTTGIRLHLIQKPDPVFFFEG